MDANGNPITLTEEQMQEGNDPQPQGAPAPTGNQPEAQPQPQPAPQGPEGGEAPEIAHDPVVTPEGQQPEGEEPPASPRQNKRIEQLLDKLHTREQEVLQRGAQPPQQRQPNRQIIPDGEYTTEEVNRMAQDYADNILQQGLTEVQAVNIANNFATRLEIDFPRVNSKYTFLDTDSDDFNPGPADFVNRMYLYTVGYDPKTGVVQDRDLRYGEFVEGFMGVVELIATGKVADAGAATAAIAAMAGPRPGGPAKTPLYQGEDPKQMSDEQLDAAIAQGLGIRK